MAERTQGRQKVEMVKMQNEIHRQITFSKRRYGLFKKVNELVSLCDAEVGLIVCSPSSKVYTFGHPNVQPVICRYLDGGGAAIVGPSNIATAVINGFNYSTDDAKYAILVVQLGQKLNNKESLLENEKKGDEILNEKINNSALYNQWSKFFVVELDVSELFEYKVALERLKMRIDAMKLKKSMEMMNPTAMLPPPNPNPFLLGYQPMSHI